MKENHALTIREWSEEDRPREKLLQQGKTALSDAELLAIVIGSGTRNESALVLAMKILQQVEGNLNRLSQLSPLDMMRSVKGIGPAKAVTIAAVMELGRRRGKGVVDENEPIQCSRQIAQLAVPLLGNLPCEEFWVFLLNNSNRLIAKRRLSQGGVTHTVVDPKVIFRYAIEHYASGLILCHNHPSGNVQPSKADKLITQKVLAGAACFDLRLVDHLVVADENYFSFADENLLL